MTGAMVEPVEPVQGDRDAVKLAFTFAFARGFQIAEETSRSCISAIDDAWEEWLAAGYDAALTAIPASGGEYARAALNRVKAIAALSDYPDDRTVRSACLVGEEYSLTFGDLRAIRNLIGETP